MRGIQAAVYFPPAAMMPPLMMQLTTTVQENQLERTGEAGTG